MPSSNSSTVTTRKDDQRPTRRRARAAAVPDADADSQSSEVQVPSRNEVVLHGRLAAPPVERELPSGDLLLTARIIVDRDPAARQRSTQRVDTLDCVAWTARVQRSMRRWSTGDLIAVTGALRRRFYRADSGPVSRVEVEVRQARRLVKAA